MMRDHMIQLKIMMIYLDDLSEMISHKKLLMIMTIYLEKSDLQETIIHKRVCY